MRIPYELIKVLRLGSFIIFIAHYLACINFLAARLSNFPAESWVVRHHLDRSDGATQYNWSLFKALYTIIGGEEMLPSGIHIGCESLQTEWCAIESNLTLASLYMGSFVYAVIIAELASIVSKLDQATALFQDKYSEINEYMRAKRLNPALRDQIRDYYSLQFKDRQIFDEEGIMKEMSPLLRQKILSWNDREIFKKVSCRRCGRGGGPDVSGAARAEGAALGEVRSLGQGSYERMHWAHTI